MNLVVSLSSSLRILVGIFYWNCRLPRWRSGEKPACPHRRHGFNLWVRKIPWSRKWQPIPIFFPGKAPWTEEPGGLHFQESQRVRHNWVSEHKHSGFSIVLRDEPRRGNCRARVTYCSVAGLEPRSAVTVILIIRTTPIFRARGICQVLSVLNL